MKNLIFILVFFFFTFGLNAQVISEFSKLSGKIISCKDYSPLSYTHIINETSNFYSLADSSGNYSISAKEGDIIRFSFIGYKTCFLIYRMDQFVADVCLIRDTFLLKEVVALPFKNYTDFKQKLLSIKLEDKEYSIPGITLKERTILHNLEDENYIKSLGFALSSPLSYLYYNFSRHEKNIRKYYELEYNKWNQMAVDKKYNREMVAAITGFKDDKLTEFMAWCNFSFDYLKTATDFEIASKVKEKYLLFCEKRSIEKDTI